MRALEAAERGYKSQQPAQRGQVFPHRQKEGAQEPSCPPKEEKGSLHWQQRGVTRAQQSAQRGKMFLCSCASRSRHWGGCDAANLVSCKYEQCGSGPISPVSHTDHNSNAIHAQGAGHGGGSRSASPSPGSVAEPVAAGQGRGSRSTSPPLPSGQTNSFVGPGKGGDATSTKRSPEPAAGVEHCHGSSKVQSNICDDPTTSVQDLQDLCLSSLMGRGGCGRELINLSGLPCVAIVSGLCRDGALPCSSCMACCS